MNRYSIISGYRIKNSSTIVVVLFFGWLFFSVLASSSAVRNWIASPLVVQNADAHGSVCYVLAGGGAIWERLDAAADLVQMGRVRFILLMKDESISQFSFKANRSWTKTEWMRDYLDWRGVPPEKIQWIEQKIGTFGTLTEAKQLSISLPVQYKSVVIVSSTPHMRRAKLAFTRVFPSDVTIIPYAATTFENSYERFHPIWLEYLKLLIYSVIA